jgi:hypothetical protein
MTTTSGFGAQYLLLLFGVIFIPRWWRWSLVAGLSIAGIELAPEWIQYTFYVTLWATLGFWLVRVLLNRLRR